jgi:hypothetical protein
MPEEVGKILQQELQCRFFNPGKGKGALEQVEDKMNYYGRQSTPQEREKLVEAFNHQEKPGLKLAKAKILPDGSIDITPNKLR